MTFHASVYAPGQYAILPMSLTHTDFWNFSRYSCADAFSLPPTLLCMVAKAARREPKPEESVVLEAMVQAQRGWGRGRG